MKFVEIQRGQWINLDDISFFQSENQSTLIVTKSGKMFTVNISPNSFAEIVRSSENTLEQKLSQISKQIATPRP